MCVVLPPSHLGVGSFTQSYATVLSLALSLCHFVLFSRAQRILFSYCFPYLFLFVLFHFAVGWLAPAPTNLYVLETSFPFAPFPRCSIPFCPFRELVRLYLKLVSRFVGVCGALITRAPYLRSKFLILRFLLPLLLLVLCYFRVRRKTER